MKKKRRKENEPINLIKMSNEVGGFALHKWEADEMLTWLDKQGKKKASYTTIVETGDGGINALVTRELPTEMKTAEESLGIDSDTYNKIVDECVFGEQKPEENKGNLEGISANWSEEEERYICKLESMVKERWALAEKAQDEEVIKNMSNLAFFLKTLNPNKKPTDKEIKTLLRTEYEKGRADAIAELQKEWSKEDENILGDIIEDVKTLRSSKTLGVIRNKISWLKSIKDRVQPQPKQEWTEEDAKPQSSTPMSYGKELEKRMCEACNRFYAPNTDSNRYSASDLFYAGVKAERDLNTLAWSEEEIEPIISDYLCGREHYGGMIGRLCHLKPKQKQTEWGKDDEAFLDDILCKLEHDLILNKDEKDWLKSLKLHPKQSLDEDTQQWIDTIINDYEDLYNTDKDHSATIQAKIGILKSLRPQNKWKPSDNELEVLRLVAEKDGTCLMGLYEQLKKLKEE